MNETIPTWWLVLSGIFFALNIVLFAVVGVLAIKLVEMQKEMKPKLAELTTKVNSIAENVDQITKHLNDTLTNVGGHAKSVAGSADHIASLASSTFERFSPLVVGVMTALRLFGAIRDFRRSSEKKRKIEDIKEAREIDRLLAKKR